MAVRVQVPPSAPKNWYTRYITFDVALLRGLDTTPFGFFGFYSWRKPPVGAIWRPMEPHSYYEGKCIHPVIIYF